jgi:hypothetical protein
MKTLPRIFALVTLSTFAFAPTLLPAQDAPPPPPDQGAPPPDQGPAPQDQGSDQDDQGASFQTFYDQLGDQGQWVQTDDYGYVFQPNVSDPNWAPYTDGHWVYTDVGWTWVSDEPWGWATYHYGRWANIDGTGWVWVPGYRWAPAWVSWRYGGGYAGWAPLPPETFVGAEYGDGGAVGDGFHFGSDVDVNFNIGPGCYNFLNIGDFGEQNYRGHYLDRNRNYVVINNTTNITNINVRGGGGAGGNFRGVSDGGPAFADVNAHSHQHLQQMQLTQANQAGRSSVNGNSLAVYAPRMNPSTQHTARPARVGQTIAHPAFNRGDSITKPLQVTSAVHATAPSQEAIAAAQQARQHAPAQAHIATENTRIKTQITATATTPAVNTPGAQKSVTPSHAESAFTGETQKPATHTQAETAQRTPTGNSPYTGEPQKPAQTFHPQTQQQPAQTFHPQTETAPVTHTAPVEKPASSSSGQVFHPQNQSEFRPSQQPATQPVFHQPSASPAQTFHPQTEERPAVPQHEAAPVVHTQVAPQHEAAPAQHEAAPAPHSQAAPAQHAAPPAAAQGGGGGNKGGNGNGNGNPQGH